MQARRLSLLSMLSTAALHLLLFSSLCEAQSPFRPSRLHGRNAEHPRLQPLFSTFRSQTKRAVNGGACVDTAPTKITAPKNNPWRILTRDETREVTKFLKDQEELNITSYTQAGPDNNILGGLVELMLPNKTDVTAYLDGDGPEPARYARTNINFQPFGESVYTDIIVGPLPVDNATTTWQVLGYPYTRKDGTVRDIYANSNEVYKWTNRIENSVKDIIKDLWPDLDPLYYYLESQPYIQSENSNTISSWHGLWNGYTTKYDVATLLPLNLFYGVEWNIYNPSERRFLGWLYNDTLYETTEAFREAYNQGSLPVFPANVDGKWAHSGQQGDILPLDTLPPPQAIAPSGSRFSWDEEAKYVQWMGFTFYLGFTYNRGMSLYDIRHKGERIIYELSLQEALAHYSGTDPVQSTTAYLDVSYGLGAAAVPLVPGYDCPSYATYVDTTAGSGSKVKNSLCFFEFDADYPIARHAATDYVSNTKNIYFVARSIYTLGNYDYMFSYEFYLDGSIKISVRASGYIRGQYYAGNEEYGYRIHDYLSGSIHDHTLNFKIDFDILGTANTMQLTSFVPTTEKYVWSETPRKTFKLKRDIVATEDTSRMNWGQDGWATQYRIMNTDKPNKYGESRGYRILPADSTGHFTNTESSNLVNAIHPFTYDLAVTRQKDTEPQSAHPLDSNDVWNPMVNFDTFFDGESLEQEDLVVWVNLGMHHLPHTGDLPNTVFTTAHAGIQLMPLNYYQRDISTETVGQVQLNYDFFGNVTKVKTFGQEEASCTVDLAKEAPDLYDFNG